MANTEGMSDDAMERLLSNSVDEPETISSSGLAKTKSALLLARRRMEQFPMSERPAARVIRPSNNRTLPHNNNNNNRGKPIISVPSYSSTRMETPSHEEEPATEVVGRKNNNNNNNTSPAAAAAIMGDVIERKSSRRRKQQQAKLQDTATTTITTTTSRFVQSALKSGFPSIHVPLGQLVDPKTNKSQNGWDNADALLSMKQANHKDATNESSNNAPTSFSIDDDNKNNNNNNETIAIERQAQAMLEQMSPTEIKEHVQDLQAALSPETIAFLKRRGQQKQNNHCKEQKPQKALGKKGENDSPKRDTDTEKLHIGNGNPDDPVEKQRLAQVLSSIRTYEDMDTAYNQEVKERFEFLGPTSSSDANINVDNDDDSFHTACDLLRSSVPRQNLWAARIVSQRLQQQQDVLNKFGSVYALGNGDYHAKKVWPYPTLLPVSLRCLLDTSVSKVNGLVLHTYVLQALYALLWLRSSRDHVHGIVDGEETNNSAAILYQEYFLDDAIPTPPLHTCYSSSPVQPLNQDNNNNSPVAYTTTSSSTSAQQDGQAFVQDPLWTLLSRMRILPRLAELLMEEQLTVEAIVAICGILTLVAQRSPGAATAIVQHPTLLRDLTERTLVDHSKEKEDGCDESSGQGMTVAAAAASSASSGTDPALATLFLGCTLARQSRIAAQGLDTVFLPRVLPLLVSSSTSLISQQKHCLQKWALVLWRTRLRYGLSLADLPTILTLAAPHCALGVDRQEGQNLLAPYFFSSLTIILHCIRAIKDTRTRSQKEKNVAVNSDDRAVLSQAGVWLSSSNRQALQHFVNASFMIETILSTEKKLSRLQHLTSILRYLDGWLTLPRSGTGEDNGEFKTEEITEMEEAKCLRAILSFFNDATAKKLFQVALKYCFWTELSELPSADGAALAYEAGSCAFVDALLALATSISTSFKSDENQIIIACVREKVLECLPSPLNDAPIDDYSAPKRPCSTELSRRHWLNRTHTSLVRFLATTAPGPVDSVTHVVGLSVIGRLEKGEESLATLLFSCDNLFRQRNKPGEPAGFISPISTFFVRELCLTEHARLQLDHSFKLRNALGITSDKMGPFDTLSLRSEVDGIPSSGSKNLLLPMGSLWLWKILGGIVVDQELSQEVGQVLLTALELVYQLETTDESAQQDYRGRLDVGGRLYFLMNMCFQPFLGQERICFLVNNLIDRYVKDIDNTSALGFAKECELHSTTSSSKEKGQTEDLSAEERQVEKLLDPSVPSTDKNWEQKQLRSVESFIGDLCDAFLDHGAQYPFFTKCLRSFLCSGFPSKIRCKLIERLRDVPNLLTLPEEKDLTSFLLLCLSGGRPSVDKSVKDTPEILDACVSLFSKCRSIRSDAFFVLAWATAMLARSLAIHLDEGREGGLAVSKRRIQSMEPSFARGVLLVTEEFLASNGTKQDLVDISVRCCRKAGDEAQFPSAGDDHNWDQVLVRLRKSIVEADKSLE